MQTFEIILMVLGGLLALVVIPIGFSKVAGRVAKVSDKVAKTGDSVSEIFKGLGMDKASMIVKEGADIPDEIEDLARVFSEMTADKKLTADELKILFKEGKDIWVEMKDFRVKVFPKKE